MTGQVVRFDYDIQSGLLNIDFELEWIDSEKGGFHNCHSRLRMLWIEHGCYLLDFDVVTVGALVAVSLVSMNWHWVCGHVIVAVDGLDLLVDYLHGKYLKELDLILEKLMCLNEQKGIETDLDQLPDFD
jgi:hypothetical protein